MVNDTNLYDVLRLFTDVNTMRDIREVLSTQQLTLLDFAAGGSTVLPGGEYALAVYILAGIAALLAVICLALLIAFFIRNRTLVSTTSSKKIKLINEPIIAIFTSSFLYLK